jgi:hypothetical protein
VSNELTTPTTPLTPDEISAVLAGAGAIDEEGEQFLRIKIDGTNFVSDDEIWMTNPKTGEPAFTARLLQGPMQYQSFWFTPEAAVEADRPDMANKFCKSHYDNPQENRERGTNGASCRACPFNPFGNEYPKCSWKGDIQFQIIPDDNVMKGDEPVWTLTLSTTGMIEWRGTRKNQTGGSATDANFMNKLANLALEKAPEWGIEPEQAIIAALTSLNGGGVAAEFRAMRMTNEQSGNTWSVPSLTPVHIELLTEETTQIESGE